MMTKTITLCGSTRFKVAFMEWNARLTLEEGACVFSVGMWSHSDVFTPSTREKCKLDAIHMMKIHKSNEIFVLDVGGYIGESTRREIEYAELVGVRIRYLTREHPSWSETDSKYWRG